MPLDLTWRMARPLLFQLDPERAHALVLSTLSHTERGTAAVLSRLTRTPRRPTRIGKLLMPGAVGLAAGLDKDAEALGVWPSLGFGFIEVGTVTAHAQPGNPRPRLFRLPAERALLNRMGFNNQGSEAMAHRLRARREAGRWPRVPVGVNIGKSKRTPLAEAVDDYLLSVRRLRGVADWLTVNVSSPNTPGLRSLQDDEPLRRLLGAIVPAAAPTPVWLKLAPDLDRLAPAIEIAVQAGCEAVVATNTTRQRPGGVGARLGDGGLSGAPLWPIARQRIGEALDAAAGRVPIVGVGGIHTASQARELLAAGCAAVQVFTGLIYEGPGLVSHLNQGLGHQVPVQV